MRKNKKIDIGEIYTNDVKNVSPKDSQCAPLNNSISDKSLIDKKILLNKIIALINSKIAINADDFIRDYSIDGKELIEEIKKLL